MAQRPFVEIVGDTAVVHFSSARLDGASIQNLGEYNRPHLNLDFAAVEQLTSTALARLVALYRRFSAAGVQISLDNVSPTIYAKLERTKLTRLFEVRRREVDAAAAEE